MGESENEASAGLGVGRPTGRREAVSGEDGGGFRFGVTGCLTGKIQQEIGLQG